MKQTFESYFLNVMQMKKQRATIKMKLSESEVKENLPIKLIIKCSIKSVTGSANKLTFTMN